MPKTSVVSINCSSHLAPLHVNVICAYPHLCLLAIEPRETLPSDASSNSRRVAPVHQEESETGRHGSAWRGLAWSLLPFRSRYQACAPGAAAIVEGPLSPAPGETARSVELVSLTLVRRESGVVVCQTESTVLTRPQAAIDRIFRGFDSAAEQSPNSPLDSSLARVIAIANAARARRN